MDLHQRQHFDLLLQMATERLIERAVQRCEGVEAALHQLRTDPDGEGVWLGRFVDAFFDDALLDNPAGACFVLQALERRPVPAAALDGRVGDALRSLAKQAFRALLTQKAHEALAQQAVYAG
ncbi:MAG: hypothetical protein AAF970_18100 [Bacteroidota bacterium]